MRKKKIANIGLIMGLIVAVGSFIFFWPHAVQAENDVMYEGDYSALWDYSYNDWGFDYTAWQTPLFNYSAAWDDNYLSSSQSYISSTENDFLGLLSQGTNIYVPPGASLYKNAYGTLGSPGGYLPPTQWPTYSYAMPSSPFGTYVFQPYAGGPIIGSLQPMTREEWWANEVESHSLEHARELTELYGIPMYGITRGFSGVPPWEEQPLCGLD